MIILTSAEADKVRGRSPSKSYAALDPVPLKDGTYMLHEDVLADPAHADVAAFLGGLPKVKDVNPTIIYGKDDTVPVQTKWQDVGVRKAIDAQAEADVKS